MLTAEQLQIETLGPCTRQSPLLRLRGEGFVPESMRIRLQHKCGPGIDSNDDLSFEEAGLGNRSISTPSGPRRPWPPAAGSRQA
jgi:hypothetical protein